MALLQVQRVQLLARGVQLTTSYMMDGSSRSRPAH